MSNRKSTTSPIRKDDDEFLNSLVQETTVETVINNNQKLFFFFVALISTWLPSYLYQGVKGLEFSGLSILLFLIVSNAAAYVLYLGYLNIFIRTKPTLTRKFDVILDQAGVAKKNNETRDQLIELGTTGFSLFFSNTLYLGLTLFFGFYAFGRADVRVSYTFSLIASAAAVYFLSTTKPRVKSE